MIDFAMHSVGAHATPASEQFYNLASWLFAGFLYVFGALVLGAVARRIAGGVRGKPLTLLFAALFYYTVRALPKALWLAAIVVLLSAASTFIALLCALADPSVLTHQGVGRVAGDGVRFFLGLSYGGMLIAVLYAFLTPDLVPWHEHCACSVPRGDDLPASQRS